MAYEVRTREEAWNKANELFPTDYEQDTAASQRAGYPIYTSTSETNQSWISDLGNRLELNIYKGKAVESTNIWVDAEYMDTLEENAQLKEENRNLRAEIEEANEDAKAWQEKHNDMVEDRNFWRAEQDKARSDATEAQVKIIALEQEIIKLKAKLYDLMTA